MPATRTMDEVIETLESGRIGFARGAERLERDDDGPAPSTLEVLRRQCVALESAHDRVRFARRARRP